MNMVGTEVAGSWSKAEQGECEMEKAQRNKTGASVGLGEKQYERGTQPQCGQSKA